MLFVIPMYNVVRCLLVRMYTSSRGRVFVSKKSEMFRFPQHDKNPTLPRLFPALPAISPHQFDRFIDHISSDIERGTKADRVFAGAKRQHSEIEEAVPKFFARLRVGKIEREKYSTAARSGDQRLFHLQVAQSIEEIGTYFRSVLDQTFLLDNAQIMRRAHHIGEVSAPCRIQTAG